MTCFLRSHPLNIKVNSKRPVVVLCADKNMEAGLHVTLCSLLKNYSRKEIGVKIYLFLEGFLNHDVSLLRKTLDCTGTFYELYLRSVELEVFKGFRGLHGNHMAYARLMLADILKDEDKFLYLDSDLLVGVDIHDLFHTHLQNQTLGVVVGGGTIEWALEKSFFLKMGLDKNQPYFNSGIILFDAILWRKNNMTQECIQFCQKHPDDLKAADQTVLNCVFQKQIFDLGKCYNAPSYSNGKPTGRELAKGQITHFVGSPKPWDLFGSILHPDYPIFKEYYNETALSGRGQIRPAKLYRTLKIGRSYFKCILAKFNR